MQTINPVIWFEIYVDDMSRAKQFYETVLGVTLSELPMPEVAGGDSVEMFAFPMEESGAGAAGTLVRMEGVKAGGNSSLVYFGSKDCSIEEGRIEAAGGRIFKSKQSLGEFGFMVLAYDTEGNMFGIHSPG